jgi:uncharacterized membrane protein YfcA
MSEHVVLSLALISIGSFALSYVGAAVGLVLGQLRVALLCYVIGNPAVGAATSLAISTVATVVGTLAHVRGGRVEPGLLLTIGAPSALAAYLSAGYAARIDARWLKAAIAVTLLLTGLAMLRQSYQMRRDPGHSIMPVASHRVEVLGQVCVGAVLGAVSGLVGLLLGSLRLPAMVKFTRVPPAKAVGTNMAIGAITGISAGISAMTGGKVSLTAFAVVCPLTLLGAYLGAHKAGRLDQPTLVRWIAYVLIPTAGIMLFEAFWDAAGR